VQQHDVDEVRITDICKEFAGSILEALSHTYDMNLENFLIYLAFYMITGVVKTWEPHERLPPCTLRTLFSRFLDITTPPTPNLLQHFASVATDPEDQRRLTLLATVSSAPPH
jgi:nitric-oxide synthase